MKQISALVIFVLAALAIFALIVRIGAALSGHCCGVIAFVVAGNSASSGPSDVQTFLKLLTPRTPKALPENPHGKERAG